MKEIGKLTQEEKEEAEEFEAKDPFHRDEDGNILPGQSYGNHFDGLLDELHDTQGDASHITQEERERVLREERAIIHVIKSKSTERLLSDNLMAIDGRVDPSTGNYEFVFTETNHDLRFRKYHVTVDIDDFMLMADARNALRVVDDVCREAKEARKKYCERMS